MHNLADEYMVSQIRQARRREAEEYRRTKQPRVAKKAPLHLLVRAWGRLAGSLASRRTHRRDYPVGAAHQASTGPTDESGLIL
jgi:hypothetical protein